MEFLLAILGLTVVWLVVKQNGRSEDSQRMVELSDLVRRLEQRISTLERAGSRPSPAQAPPTQPFVQSAVKTTAPEAPGLVTPEVRVPLADSASLQDSPAPAPMPQPVPSPASVQQAPPAVAAYRAAVPVAPLKTSTFDMLREPAEPKHSPSLEERFGTNWLNKLGIIILVIGVSLFLAYNLRTMGPAGKTAVGAVLSLSLLVGGLILERKDRYRVFARAGIGGGWALTFFLSYAMYHVEATHVISSQFADLILMMVVAVGMVLHSLRYKSQVVTGLAFLLAFVTVGISHVTLFSLAAGALLAAGLVYVTAREYWYELGLAGLVGVYLNHFLWLQRVLPDGGVPGFPFPEFTASAGLLLLYWFIFRLAYVLRVPRTEKEELLASGTAILNSVGLMGLLKYQSSHPEWAFLALIALGAAEMLFAIFAWRRRRPAFVMLSSIASILLLAAVPLKFSGSNWSLFWLLEAEALFFAGLRLREPVFRRLGMVAGFAAAIQLLFIDGIPIFELRQNHPDGLHHWPAAIAFLAGGLVFWGNAHLVPLRWKDLLEHEFDAASITITSYAGLIVASIGLWVAFPGAATVVAWMVLCLIVGLAADKLASGDFAIQADLLGLAALVRVFLINLQLDGHWGPVSQRALSVGIAGALFYLGMRRRTKPYSIAADYIPAAYSWSGSAILGSLVWYELRPISVAIGWGVLGMVLFELGFVLRRSFLRQQGYALLAASFIRIFFANVSVGGTSHLNSPRLYTVLPLIAAYFWVYERLQGESESSVADRVTRQVTAWAALIALATLAYFEVDAEWVVVAWAVMVLVLLSVGWLLKRPIFVAQSVALLLITGSRAMMFNLFSSPPLTTDFWNSRTLSITETCIILLLALPIAFKLRSSAPSGAAPEDLKGALSFALDHPEQGLFFVPVVLATVFLAIQMRAGMITISWSALGVFIFLFALLVRERSYRLAGLCLLLLGVGKIIVVDIWSASPSDRYITLIVMGASLLLISFLYTRYREAILKLL